MRLTLTALMLAVLTACHGAPAEQDVSLSGGKQLVLHVEGVEARYSSVQSQGTGPMHRLLQSLDGSTLFAYELEVQKQDGGYRFLLKPAAKGPTLAKAREVVMTPGQESVRVELMQQPATGKKIVDVFEINDAPKMSATDPVAHVIKAHEMFARWLHSL